MRCAAMAIGLLSVGAVPAFSSPIVEEDFDGYRTPAAVVWVSGDRRALKAYDLQGTVVAEIPCTAIDAARCGDAGDPDGLSLQAGVLWYVDGERARRIYRIDPATGSVTATIETPSRTTQDVEIVGGILYATDYGARVLYRLDPRSGEPVDDPIPLPDFASPIAMTYADGSFWIVDAPTEAPGGHTRIGRVDPRTGARIGPWLDLPWAKFSDIAWDGRLFYGANDAVGSGEPQPILVFDPADLSGPVASIPTDIIDPQGIAVVVDPRDAVPDRWRRDTSLPGGGTIEVSASHWTSPPAGGHWRRTSGYFVTERRFPRIRPAVAHLRYHARLGAFPLNAAVTLWPDDDADASPGGPSFFGDGLIKYVDAAGGRHELMPYRLGRWYGFDVRYDLRAQTYDFAIQDLEGEDRVEGEGIPFRGAVRGLRRLVVYTDSGSPDPLDLWLDDVALEAVYRVAVLGTGTEEETNLASLVERLCGEIGIDAIVDSVDVRDGPTSDDLLSYCLVVESEPELLYHRNNPNRIDPADLRARGTSVLLLEDAIHDAAQSPAYGGRYASAAGDEIRVEDPRHPAMLDLRGGEGACISLGGDIVGLAGAPPAIARLATACEDDGIAAAGAQDRAGPDEGRLLFMGTVSASDYAVVNGRRHEDLLRAAVAWLLDVLPSLGVRPFAAGEEEIVVELDAPQPVDGFSFGLAMGGEAPCPGFAGARPGPDLAEPGFWAARIHDGGRGVTVACVVAIGPGPDARPIQPGEGVGIVSVDLAGGARCPVCFTGDLGDPPVRVRVVPAGGGASLRPTAGCAAPAVLFRRGDANANNDEVDLADAVHILRYLYSGGPAPCLDAMDTEDTGRVDLGDPIYLLNWLFLGGPPLPDPGPAACGPDPTPDALPCEAYDNC